MSIITPISTCLIKSPEQPEGAGSKRSRITLNRYCDFSETYLIKIMTHFNLEDMARVARVNRNWHRSLLQVSDYRDANLRERSRIASNRYFDFGALRSMVMTNLTVKEMARTASVSSLWNNKLPTMLLSLTDTLNKELSIFSQLIFKGDQQAADLFIKRSNYLLKTPCAFDVKNSLLETRQLAGWFLISLLTKEGVRISYEELRKAPLPHLRAAIDSALELFNWIQNEHEAGTLNDERLQLKQKELVAADRLEEAVVMTAATGVANALTHFLIPMARGLLEKDEVVRTYLILASTPPSQIWLKAVSNSAWALIKKERLDQTARFMQTLLSKPQQRDMITNLTLGANQLFIDSSLTTKVINRVLTEPDRSRTVRSLVLTLLQMRNFNAANRVAPNIEDNDERSFAWNTILEEASSIENDESHDKIITQMLNTLVDNEDFTRLSRLIPVVNQIRDDETRLNWQASLCD